MIQQYQMCQVTVKAAIDNQAVNNVMWYYTPSSGGMLLETLVTQVKELWRIWVLAKLAAIYSLYEVEGKALIGLENTYSKTVTNTLTGVRKNWSETFSWSGELLGQTSGTNYQNSFTAYSVEKAVGNPKVIVNDTGVATAVSGAGKIKAGGMRISGLVEENTSAGQPNKLVAAARTNMQAAMDALRRPTVNLLTQIFSDGDEGKILQMAVVSEVKGGKPRVLPHSSSDVTTWVPAVLVYDVTSLNVGNYVTSQVSRRRAQKKFD